MRWEYKILEAGILGTETKDKLNANGNAGWEAIAFIPTKAFIGSGVVVFKRPMKADSASN